jgi:hypothetical protein
MARPLPNTADVHLSAQRCTGWGLDLDVMDNFQVTGAGHVLAGLHRVQMNAKLVG